MRSPFDPVHYARLLEGLEISEARFSEIISAIRFDAEYFRPSLITLEKRLHALPHTTLGTKTKFVAGPFGSEFIVENYDDASHFRYIRGKDVKSFFVESDDNMYIPEKDFHRLSEHSVNNRDVLVSVVGTLGNACIATKKDLPAIFSCKSTVIRQPEVNPFYLVSFLNSGPGKSLLLRNARGTVQLGLNLPDLRQLLIPKFSKRFEDIIEKAIKLAQDQLETSKAAFLKAEETLLRALGLANWQSPEALSYTRRASKALAAGRLDAEHFDPRHEEIIDMARSAGADTQCLGDLIGHVVSGFDYRDFTDEGTPYIRVGDIKRGRIEHAGAERVGIKANSIGKDIQLQVGDVLFTRKGSFGNAAPVRKEQEQCLISSEIMRLRILPHWRNRLLPEFLVAYFNGVVGQSEAKRWAHGRAFYSVSQGDLSKFVVPIPSLQVQTKLREYFDSAEESHKHAHALLNASKCAVEIAIAHSEVEAMVYLTECGV